MSNPMEPRPLTSAFESPTFGEDSSFHVEQPVGSMSISPCGRDVVLASKEGLHVIDLDSPYSPPRYLPHRTPWEVADVQWSPFAARDYWVASTSNQKALVWNLGMKSWQNPIEHVLHAHSRAITDINFSAHHPDRLATCAVDSFVHCWDLRTPSRPAISFSDWFAGATQVKWNRQDPHVIASSHDRFLRIWDDRMGAYPIKSIEAHNTKIYGVDWNRVRPGAVVTCSLDKTIKFWDYTIDSDVPEKIIRAPFPVWRARNTPFGWGVLAMPQRGNSDLHLYSRRAGEGANPDENLPLVHTFPGHKGQVKEFLWRPRGGVSDGIDCREFQLVSWGTDRELRLHKVDPDILERVGYEKGKTFISTLNITRKGAVYKSFRDANDDEYDEMEPASHGSTSFSNGIGMNTISIPYARAWTQGGRVDSRVGMQGRSNIRADPNPISWMRGVKISGWDIETLGDEITHVGEKFTKISFESVDVRQRKATISLHGPWGAEGDSLFLKVDIKFPVDYPKDSMPLFTVQKTAAVTDELSSNISAELRTIAETYLSRKRGCLEGVVRYLLGESTLEESIAWILGEAGETVKSPVNGELEGESSDEDEVGLSRSQDLGMSSELLRPPNANVMVPVAKACGALWAQDGRLVCFFPPKKDKSAAFLENLGFKEMARLSRADKVFEGFGRLQANSPGPQVGALAPNAEEASDYSDDSDEETSSSSGSSDILSGLPNRFPTPRTWRSGGGLGFPRPKSTDNSQLSTAAGMTNKSSSEAPKNVVSIHDFSDMLPAKRKLAHKYRISGKGTDVCAYNASVALDAGYHELAHIWGLVKLILHNKEAIALPFSDFPQHSMSGQIQRRDSAVDMTYDFRDQGQGSKRPTNSVIPWGEHPFGSKWLVPSLFDHFERLGDLQMLGMLSCILDGSNRESNSLVEACHREQSASRRKEGPSFLLDLYSDNGVAQVKSQVATPLGSTPKDPHATPITHSSGRSSTELWRPDTSPPYSTGTTPPLNSRGGVLTAEKKSGSQNVTIASSPDQQSQPRSGSGLGSVLASSLTRSFTFGPSSASPPASVLNKKKNTSDSPQAGVGPGAWTTSAFTTKPVSAVPDYLTTSTALTSGPQSDTESERPQPSPRRPGKVKMTLKNQGAFDNGHSKNSFLDPDRDWLYRAYRAEYANLLSGWGLPVQQSEVLKIGGPVDRSNLHASHRHHRSLRASFSLPGGPMESHSAVNPESQSLDIQQHCPDCGHALHLSISAPSTGAETPAKRHIKKSYPSAKCPRCDPGQRLSTKLPCVVCGEMIERMLIPCLNCGHVSCFSCHKAWFSRTSDATEDTSTEEFRSCPTGCGCNCSEHTVLDAPMFSNSACTGAERDADKNTRTQISPRARRTESRQASGEATVGQNEDDLDAWQVSPFATLARGLGGGLSRGLRVDDKRKSKPFVPKRTSMNRVENG